MAMQSLSWFTLSHNISLFFPVLPTVIPDSSHIMMALDCSNTCLKESMELLTETKSRSGLICRNHR